MHIILLNHKKFESSPYNKIINILDFKKNHQQSKSMKTRKFQPKGKKKPKHKTKLKKGFEW